MVAICPLNFVNPERAEIHMRAILGRAKVMAGEFLTGSVSQPMANRSLKEKFHGHH
jgi:hypothetical protein